MTDANLIEIFCILDESCKYFNPELKKHLISEPGRRHHNRLCRLSDGEVMTILVLFHTKHFRDLKSFYLGYVCQHMRKEFSIPFPTIVSWSVSLRLPFICCCFCRPADWENALGFPLLIQHRWFHAT
jgi:hypothetical protein